MSKFIVRVEMHEPFTNYGLLHSLMENAGFRRQIRSDDGELYQLPTAEYVFDAAGDFSAVTVRDYAKQTAERTLASAWVLVTRYDQAAWVLPVVHRETAKGLLAQFM